MQPAAPDASLPQPRPRRRKVRHSRRRPDGGPSTVIRVLSPEMPGRVRSGFPERTTPETSSRARQTIRRLAGQEARRSGRGASFPDEGIRLGRGELLTAGCHPTGRTQRELDAHFHFDPIVLAIDLSRSALARRGSEDLGRAPGGPQADGPVVVLQPVQPKRWKRKCTSSAISASSKRASPRLKRASTKRVSSARSTYTSSPPPAETDAGLGFSSAATAALWLRSPASALKPCHAPCAS